MNLIAGCEDHIAAGIGDRRGIDPDHHILAVARIRFARVVYDGQPDRVGPRLVEAMGDDAAMRVRAVAELPMIIGDISVGIERGLASKMAFSPGTTNRSGPGSAIGRALMITVVESFAVLRCVPESSVTVR